MLIFQREYMEMCFHGNQLSWGIKHPFISLCSEYHSPGFICLSTMLAPVISSLDEIYCTYLEKPTHHYPCGNNSFLFSIHYQFTSQVTFLVSMHIMLSQLHRKITIVTVDNSNIIMVIVKVTFLKTTLVSRDLFLLRQRS